MSELEMPDLLLFKVEEEIQRLSLLIHLCFFLLLLFLVFFTIFFLFVVDFVIH